jgi:hypothetical protein
MKIKLVVCAAMLLLGAMEASAQKSLNLLNDLLNQAGRRNAPNIEQPTAPNAAGMAENKPAIENKTGVMPAAVNKPTVGDAPVANARYSFSDDGKEVTDSQTGLVWRRCAEGMTWNGATCAGEATNFSSIVQAETFAKTQASASQLAWRVPNKEELISLVRVYQGKHDPVAFPATPAYYFCSSHRLRPEATDGYKHRVQCVHFANGSSDYTIYRDYGETSHLRLVRKAK